MIQRRFGVTGSHGVEAIENKESLIYQIFAENGRNSKITKEDIFGCFFPAKTAHHTHRHAEPWQNTHHFTSHRCAVRSASFISLLVFSMNSASLRRWRPWDQVNGNILRKPAAVTYLQPWQESVIKPRHKPICAIWHFFRAIVPVNLIQPLKSIGGIEWTNQKTGNHGEGYLKGFPLWIRAGRMINSCPFILV